MKKFIYGFIILPVSLFVCFSCTEFEGINTNPEAPTEATASLLTRQLIASIMKPPGAKTFSYDQMIPKYMAWWEGAQSAQYNYFGRTSFSDYRILINCEKMMGYVAENETDAYQGLISFIKAYRLYYVSMKVGDIPYRDALKGETGNVTPQYDTQKEVMLQILDDLEASYASFSKSEISEFRGDIIYDGNVEQWKKAVTAFQLKVLINLSKKQSDTDLNIKSRFAKIVQENALFESNEDNMQLVFANQSGMIYPFHNTQTKHAPYVMVSSVLIDSLKKYEDYRLFYFANPAVSQINAGISESSWEAYIGTDPSLPFSEISQQKSEDRYSTLNSRYTEYEPAEPLIRSGYAEQNFILAEAALRGWITEQSATYYYKKAIEGALRFVMNKTPLNETYNHGMPITEAYIQSHIEKPELQLTGSTSTFEKDLNKIITQKYMSSFMQLPLEAYYDYRRTGYPKLPINPETNQNEVKDKIPVRYMYPQGEIDNNRENAEAAIQRQYNGNDNVNELMWILQ